MGEYPYVWRLWHEYSREGCSLPVGWKSFADKKLAFMRREGTFARVDGKASRSRGHRNAVSASREQFLQQIIDDSLSLTGNPIHLAFQIISPSTCLKIALPEICHLYNKPLFHIKNRTSQMSSNEKKIGLIWAS